MKRTVLAILCAIMLISSALAEDSATVTVNGVGELVTVTLTMEDDRIISVEATTDNTEADERGRESLSLITTAMVEKNSVNVDAISGATCTSNAVIAGATEAWLQIMTERMSQEDWMQKSEEKTIDLTGGMEPLAPADLGQSDNAFYGVWIAACQEKNEAEALVSELNGASYVFSPDWENLGQEFGFRVTMGRYETQAEAEKQLPDVKEAGYADAYVEYTGPRLGHRLYYILFDVDEVTVQPSQVLIPIDRVDDLSGEYTEPMTLIVDEDTVFADSCDLEYFDNYREGDTPLSWFQHNMELIDSDPSLIPPYPLVGEFEVSVTGDHIDSFYGCYWWD